MNRDFRAIDALFVLLLAFLLMIVLGRFLPPKALMFANAGLFVAVVVGAWARRKSPAPLLASGRVTPLAFIWMIVGSAGIFLLMISLVDPLIDLFPRDYSPELEKLQQEILAIPPALAIFLLVFLAPLCEEVFFRGALLTGFRTSWGTLAGVLASSAIFAVSHGMPPRMVATFFLGMWFAALAIRSGGLALPFLAHAFNNGLVLILMGAGLQGLSPAWALPGAAALLLACWFLFGSRARSVQGSAPSGPS
jgi:membrane protease YdiL (CAAX protease family)